MKGLPRPGRGVLLRAAIAGALTIALSATAVASAVLLQIHSVTQAFLGPQEGRRAIEIPGVTRAQAGDPRTFLILGSDARYSDRKLGLKPRSDTILLVRANPDTKSIAVMSIPRDLKVKIPGHGSDKINAAYEIGGPRETVATIKRLFRGATGQDFPINNVINVNFGGIQAGDQLHRRRLRRHRPPLLQRQHDGGAGAGLRHDRHPAGLPEAQGPGRARLRALPPRRQRLLPRRPPAGLPAPDLGPGQRPPAARLRQAQAAGEDLRPLLRGRQVLPVGVEHHRAARAGRVHDQPQRAGQPARASRRSRAATRRSTPTSTSRTRPSSRRSTSS